MDNKAPEDNKVVLADIEMGQGPAKMLPKYIDYVVTSDSQKLKTSKGSYIVESVTQDEHRYTDPNLHRRIVNTECREDHQYDGSVETREREYQLGIYGNNSYRTVTRHTHEDRSNTSEIP